MNNIVTSLGKIFPLFIVIILLILGAVFIDPLKLSRYLFEELVVIKEGYFYLFVLGFVVTYALIVTCALPLATMASLLAGFMFDFWLALAVILLSVGLGLVGNMHWARCLMSQKQTERLQQYMMKWANVFSNAPIRTLIILRLLPIVPFVLVNLLPTFVPIKGWIFVMVSMLAIIPGAVALILVAQGVEGIWAGQQDSLLWLGVGVAFVILCQQLGQGIMKKWDKTHEKS